MKYIACCLLLAFLFSPFAYARLIPATPADYTNALPTLVPGDTLALAAGTHTLLIDADGLRPGMHFLRIRTKSNEIVKGILVAD